MASTASAGLIIFSIFIMLIGLVAMVLGIILFFKVWRMTNDVHKIKEILLRKEASQATPTRRFAGSARPETASGENTGSSSESEPYWKDHSRYAPPGA